MQDQRRRQRTSTMRIRGSSILLWSLPGMAGAFHMPATRTTIRAAHSNPGGTTEASRRTSTFGYASSKSTTATPTTALQMLGVTYPSFDEMIAGGERYEMVPMPDSMCETTLWVGNLCEFTTDEQLSDLFSEVSVLSSLPACVARNPNASSRKYGFVTFPSVEEKENAIIKMHGRKLNAKRIKVEPITDFKGQNRVRVPGKIVAYVLGYVPKEDEQASNESRTNASLIDNNPNKRHSTGNNSGSNKAKKKNSKRNGGGGGRQPMFERLPESDQRAFERASRKGFVTLEGTGYRRGRKSSPLANLHREWCDKRSKPQIVLCKASGGRPLDNVIVDLSPLRLGILSPDGMDAAILKYKKQIIKAAEASGMTLRSDYVEDNSEKVAIVEVEEQTGIAEVLIGVPTFDSSAWAKKPISSLPTVSMGVFEGERVCAKRMVKALSTLWQVPDDEDDEDAMDDYDMFVSIPSRSSGTTGISSPVPPADSGGSTPGRRRNKGYINGKSRTKMKKSKKMKLKGLREHRKKSGRRNQDFSSCW